MSFEFNNDDKDLILANLNGSKIIWNIIRWFSHLGIGLFFVFVWYVYSIPVSTVLLGIAIYGVGVTATAVFQLLDTFLKIMKASEENDSSF